MHFFEIKDVLPIIFFFLIDSYFTSSILLLFFKNKIFIYLPHVRAFKFLPHTHGRGKEDLAIFVIKKIHIP